MNEKYFYSIGHPRTTTIKIKRSVFICTLEYVASVEAAKKFISRKSKENKTATHNCWAYVLGEKGEVFHCSDAGEPSGTAGKPMLSTLQRHYMTHIAAVVTRYFGGVKLGVRGLIEAYSTSVENTIDLEKLKKLVQTASLVIEVSYGFNEILLNQIKNNIIRIEDTVYAEKIVHTIEIERENYVKMEKRLSEYQSQEKLKFSYMPKV
ncbi:MAG: YigZ family protein [Proteobacteria bacterium]|nr:YigZ family protein [Pseudomonadota bacterium]MBU1581572.1 YigZ family protein [Pseudomonadota bacterium]MBU2452461.1 YigZ family protein [Pseudomonadota bacterium]MBU2631474.1 YigZ family protein [Pseudomonadota bacterium]